MKLDSEQLNDKSCPRIEIAEYLDGELSSRDEFALEFHFADCKICTSELNAQKDVSDTLEILLEEEKEDFELPENFTKIVTANAESSLDGLRSPKEGSRAIIILAILSLFLLFGIGTKGETFLYAINHFAYQFFAVGEFIAHLFYTIILGVSTILGSFVSNFVFASSLTLLALVAALIVTSILLSRMLLKFNRT